MSQEVAGFCFHEVTDDPRSTGFQRRGAVPFRLTPRVFNDHLEAIARSPWSPCRVAELDRGAAGRHLLLTFDDGVDVVELLMAAYQSAEEERTLAFPPEGLDAFVPAVARGEWRG